METQSEFSTTISFITTNTNTTTNSIANATSITTSQTLLTTTPNPVLELHRNLQIFVDLLSEMVTVNRSIVDKIRQETLYFIHREINLQTFILKIDNILDSNYETKLNSSENSSNCLRCRWEPSTLYQIFNLTGNV